MTIRYDRTAVSFALAGCASEDLRRRGTSDEGASDESAGVTADGVGADGAGADGGLGDCADALCGLVFCAGPLPHAAARDDCTARGGCLAEVADAAQNDCMYGSASFGQAWIGLAQGPRVDPDGEWAWECGTSPFRNWAPGEPSDTPPGEDCAAMYGDASGVPAESLGRWNDSGCGSSLPYFCMGTVRP